MELLCHGALYPHPPSTPEREGRDAPIVSHLKSKWVLYFFSKNPHGVFCTGVLHYYAQHKLNPPAIFQEEKNFHNS